MVNFCKGVEDWKTWGKVRETFGKTRINKGSTVTALIVFFFFWRASAQDSDQVLMSSRGIVMIETYLEVLLHEKYASLRILPPLSSRLSSTLPN